MTVSSLASVHATRDVLERFGLQTKKALGQHFLIDDHIVEKTIALSGVSKEDVVVEVGPGIGTLTVALLAASRGVIAIERDKDLYPVLDETCAQDSDKFVLIGRDALCVDRSDIVEACSQFGRLPRMLVANLPYAVAATLILAYFERFDFLGSATVMVQSEVADRIAARPGTKDYGAYTVKLRLLCDAVDRFPVSPESFFPPPRVASSVVALERRCRMFDGAPASPELIDAASLAADAAFSQRRKNIANSMYGYLGPKGFSKNDILDILTEVGVDPKTRGETLDIDDFLGLGDILLASGAQRRGNN